ncbi:MAG TPA: CDGSH iron-sulfur domain-containing protein [Rhodothermales bacterium]|nr:CDGSH iron-sulfur domain-containing protein [Rhodothermales bacterium]
MKQKIHEYNSDDIEVQYDVVRCIHAAECVRGLPRVFNPNKRPWIDPDEASAAAIAEVVTRCPTGALHFTRKDGGSPETLPDTNTITIAPDGPLYLRGDIEVTTPDGTTLLKDTRVALCRCGASENKPFCDGSHAEAGFEDPGVYRDVQVKPPENRSETGPLTVQPSKDGPFLMQGVFELCSAGDQEPVPARQTALCRCGQSANKPFCDGSHRQAGFKDG